MSIVKKIVEAGTYKLLWDGTQYTQYGVTKESFYKHIASIINFYFFDSNFYNLHCDEDRKPTQLSEFERYVERKLENIEDFILENFDIVEDDGIINLQCTIDYDQAQQIAKNIRMNHLTYALSV